MRLVIKAHRPGSQIALWVIGGLLIGLLSVVLLDGGRGRNAYQRTELPPSDSPEVDPDSETELVELRRQVAVLRWSAQTDKQAYLEVQQNLSRLQDRLHALTEEVEFYRGMVSANKE